MVGRGGGGPPVNGHSWVWPLLLAPDLCSLLGVKAWGEGEFGMTAATTAQVKPRGLQGGSQDRLSCRSF